MEEAQMFLGLRNRMIETEKREVSLAKKDKILGRRMSNNS